MEVLMLRSQEALERPGRRERLNNRQSLEGKWIFLPVRIKAGAYSSGKAPFFVSHQAVRRVQ